ncbi:hypothetical protein [Streptomyces sp. NPDC048603]|uniref:hypothetical protein n=1 Tax=Streptomyces sp. NPDC048603 TaxID=3365577 RepID=UPI0037165EFF
MPISRCGCLVLLLLLVGLVAGCKALVDDDDADKSGPKPGASASASAGPSAAPVAAEKFIGQSTPETWTRLEASGYGVSAYMATTPALVVDRYSFTRGCFVQQDGLKVRLYVLADAFGCPDRIGGESKVNIPSTRPDPEPEPEPEPERKQDPEPDPEPEPERTRRYVPPPAKPKPPSAPRRDERPGGKGGCPPGGCYNPCPPGGCTR